MRRGRKNARGARKNPPAYFVIDPATNIIEYISRAAKSVSGMDAAFRKATMKARALAARKRRPLVVVVHPYIPKHFKRGSQVTPLFYHYRAQVVHPDGRMSAARNPLTRKSDPQSCIRQALRWWKCKGYRGNPPAFRFKDNAGRWRDIVVTRRPSGTALDPHKGPMVYIGLDAKTRRVVVPGYESPEEFGAAVEGVLRGRLDLESGVAYENPGNPLNLREQAHLRKRVAGHAKLSKAHTEPWIRGYHRGASDEGEEVARMYGLPIRNPRSGSRAEKRLDKEIERAWYRLAFGIQVDIMDIPRIFRDVKTEMALGVDLDTAVQNAIRKYRKNPLTRAEAAELREEASFLRADAREDYTAGDVRGGAWADGKASGLQHAAHWYGWRARRGKNPNGRGEEIQRALSERAKSSRRRGGRRGRPARGHVCDDDCRSFGCPVYLGRPTKPPGWRENPSRYGSRARDFISKKIPILMDEGYPQKQAVAIAMSEARRRGYRVPRANGYMPESRAAKEVSRAARMLSKQGLLSAIDKIEGRGYSARMGLRGMPKADLEEVFMHAYFDPPAGSRQASVARSKSVRFNPKRNGTSSVLVASPSKLEVEKIVGWLGREGVPAWADVHKKQWGVMVPTSKFSRARHVLGRVLRKNPSVLSHFSKLPADIVGGLGFGIGAGIVQRYIIGRNPGKRSRCNPRSCRNPRHKHPKRNPLLQSVTLAGLNPGPPKCPFRDGQRIKVEVARAWVVKSGNKELLRQFDEALKLQIAANRKPKYVTWKTIPVGDPKRLEMVTAMAEYGSTDESVYKPIKGSKKGNHWYKHEWGEGSGRKKPVPVLASSSGKAVIMPLGKGQTIGDWMRG